MSTDDLKIVLAPITTSDDVPALVRLHTAAYQPDQFSNFMLHGREENTHQNLMTKSLAFWLSDPAAQLVQALDENIGKIVGWACWVRKGEKAVSEATSSSNHTSSEGEKTTLTNKVEVKKTAPATKCTYFPLICNLRPLEESTS